MLRKRITGEVEVKFECGCHGLLKCEIYDDPTLGIFESEEEAYFTDFLPCDNHDEKRTDAIDAWEVLDFMMKEEKIENVEEFFEEFDEYEVKESIESFLTTGESFEKDRTTKKDETTKKYNLKSSSPGFKIR